MSKVELSFGRHGIEQGKIIVDGVDLSHLVRRVAFDQSVGDVMVVELELIPEITNVSAEAQVVIDRALLAGAERWQFAEVGTLSPEETLGAVRGRLDTESGREAKGDPTGIKQEDEGADLIRRINRALRRGHRIENP
jgi:hypothetical protein